MPAAAILGEDGPQRLRVEAASLKLVQRQPFGADLRVVRQVPVSYYCSVFQSTGEHEFDVVHLGVGFGKLVVLADVFPQAHQVADRDVDREFLTTLSLEGGGERLAGLLPTAGQDIVDSFGIQIFGGEDMAIDDDDGLGRIPDWFHVGSCSS